MLCPLPAGQRRASSGLRYSKLAELRSHRCQPAFEDADDLAANIGRRDGSSIHEPTPTVDSILVPTITSLSLRYTAMRRLVSSICSIRSSTVLAYFPLTDKR